jgi:molybdopterin-containing oxidoreductase family iron-sulfur binding subunit
VKLCTSGTRQIRKGSNEKVAQLIEDMKAGSVHTLIMSGVNVYFGGYSFFVEGLKSDNFCFFNLKSMKLL